MTLKTRVTVINDYPEFLDLMGDFLSAEGYDVTLIPKHQNAFAQIKESQPDIIVCDLIFDNMPHGWALVDMLYLDPQTRPIPIILCTAATKQVSEIVPSLSAKGIRWLEKPFEIEQLLAMLQELEKDKKEQS